jgi:hypothetical protein
MMQHTKKNLNLLTSIIGYDVGTGVRSYPNLRSLLQQHNIQVKDDHYYPNGLIGLAKLPKYAVAFLEMLRQPWNQECEQIASVLTLVEKDHTNDLYEAVAKVKAMKSLRRLLVINLIGKEQYKSFQQHFHNIELLEDSILPTIGAYLKVSHDQR